MASDGVYTATPLELVLGTFATSALDCANANSAGTAKTVSRGDHTHKVPVATGDSNGQVKIAGQNVTVKGLGSAAYKDESGTWAISISGTATRATKVGHFFYDRISVYPGGTSPAAGWRRVCKISGRANYAWFFIQFNGGWNNGAPSNVTYMCNTRHSAATLTLLSGGFTGLLNSVRLVNVSGNTFYLDVYMAAQANEVAEQVIEVFGNVATSEYGDGSIYSGSVTAAAELAVSVVSGTSLTSSNYTTWCPTKTGSGASGTWGINITGNASGTAGSTNKLTLYASDTAGSNTSVYATNGLNVRWFQNTGKLPGQPAQWGFLATFSTGDASSETHQIWMTQADGAMYHRGTNSGNYTAPPAFHQLWQAGNSITGAVWNDYAEYRNAPLEYGRVMIEKGDDSLIKSTERLQPFAGVVSDTWGFCQGKTDEAQAPIAVSGRVLVYPFQNKENYKSGDCVCTAPNGTVDIMTRSEIINYPDRIVGTVSCVPDYKIWGAGPDADRDPVEVDGRIWIKVR